MPLVLVLLALLLPRAAHAQIDVVFSGTRPVLRAQVGPLIISAGVGSRGLDVRTETRATSSRTTRTTSSRTTRTTRSSTTRSRSANATASSVLATADSYVGTRYVWGGETPNGFDCSGFVQYVFRQHGIELPRTSRQQAQVGQFVSRSVAALEPGDLMFFASNGSRIDHVGIYAGGDRVINASGSADAVVYDEFESRRGRWFLAHHVATRRVISDGRNLVGTLPAYLLKFMQFDPPDHAPKR